MPKLREWRDNGARLGWLILPDQREVWRYTPKPEPERLDAPVTVGDAGRGFRDLRGQREAGARVLQ